MPELPEVETIRQDLALLLKGKRILSVDVLADKSAQPNPDLLKKGLISRRFDEVHRVGKLLIFSISKKDFLLVHLRMTGQLIYVGRDGLKAGGHSDHGKKNKITAAKLPNNHTRIILNLSGGAKLYFNDLRKFGFLRLVDSNELELIKEEFGIEPLDSRFTVANLTKFFSNRSTAMKSLLLDQHVIAGLGNIYVDESLFAAGIDPRRPANSLKADEIKKLREAIKNIIAKAIRLRGTTFSDFVDSSGKSGNYSKCLVVYGRKGEVCPRCQGPIAKIRLFGRGTHYCPNCQK